MTNYQATGRVDKRRSTARQHSTLKTTPHIFSGFNFKPAIRSRGDGSCNSCSTTILPDDVWMHCFTFLTVSDLGNVQSTFRHWNNVVNTDDKDKCLWLWKHAYELRFNYPCSTCNNNTQKVTHHMENTKITPSKKKYDWKYHLKNRMKLSRGWCDPKTFSTNCRFTYSINSNIRDSNKASLIFNNRSNRKESFYGRYSQSIRSRNELLEYANGWRYFEATVYGEVSVGIVSISTYRDRKLYGKGSELHVGWVGNSYGYHIDLGCVLVPGDQRVYDRFRYRKIRYGPAWGSCPRKQSNEYGSGGKKCSSVVGCGYNLMTNQLFFTCDGNFLGIVPCEVYPGRYAAAVGLHELDDRVEINCGQFPFVFDIDEFS